MNSLSLIGQILPRNALYKWSRHKKADTTIPSSFSIYIGIALSDGGRVRYDADVEMFDADEIEWLGERAWLRT